MDPRATKDGTANSYVRDVVGNKQDAATIPTAISTTLSLMAYIKALLTAIGFIADAAVTTVGSTSSIMSYLICWSPGSALACGGLDLYLIAKEDARRLCDPAGRRRYHFGVDWRSARNSFGCAANERYGPGYWNELSRSNYAATPLVS